MIKLQAVGLKANCWKNLAGTIVLRATENVNRPDALRRAEAYLFRGGDVPDGFSLYLTVGSLDASDSERLNERPYVNLPEDFDYLRDGDVVRIDPARESIRVLYRRESSHNSFLVTERCNHYCLMCSQPPRDIDDSWILDEIKSAIPLMDRDTREIGFTGGEPTLLGDQFLNVLALMKSYLPETAVHILTNGRRFSDRQFAEAYAQIDHPDVMVGIPLYSDISSIHDFVVQADGAFDDTLRGILNLKRLRQRVEIRVVVHKQTFKRLPQLAYFLARNLTFVDHVAFMGLEMMGFTKANISDLWIDPIEYQNELDAAVSHLFTCGMNVSIYNHQLCLIPKKLWKFARKSISDWKNEYMPECSDCIEREACGGFFASAKFRYSDHIRPFREVVASA